MKFWRPIYDSYPFLRQMEEADVVLLSLTLILFVILVFYRQYLALLVTSIALLFFNMFFIMDLPKFPFQWLAYPRIDFPLLIYVASLIIGVWGAVHYFKEVMVTILKSDAVVDRWNRIVEQGAGHGDAVLGTIQRLIIDAHMPGVATRQEPVAMELFGESRPFLIVTNTRYKEFKMYINARDFGSNLDVSWYFVAEPHFLKRTMSKYATGNPQDLTMRVSLFAQQDISAFTSVTHEYVKRALEMLYEELKLDPTGLNQGSRGFLNVW